MKKFYLILLTTLFFQLAHSQQARFSLATDLSVQRSLKKGQQYWAIGQNLYGHFSFSPTSGLYLSFNYYSNGKFSNSATATAKDISIIPQKISFTNNAELKFRHLSVGWKEYVKGSFAAEEKWNIYGLAGLGVIIGNASNTQSVSIDTSNYFLPISNGSGGFRRLTLDLGIGIEKPVGGDVFAYAELKTVIPVSSYPSRYLYDNHYTPLTASVNIGLRILFD